VFHAFCHKSILHAIYNEFKWIKTLKCDNKSRIFIMPWGTVPWILAKCIHMCQDLRKYNKRTICSEMCLKMGWGLGLLFFGSLEMYNLVIYKHACMFGIEIPVNIKSQNVCCQKSERGVQWCKFSILVFFSRNPKLLSD